MKKIIKSNYSVDLKNVLSYQQTKKEEHYNELLKKYMPLLRKKASSIVNGLYNRDNSIDFDDVLSELKICLLKAIERIKLEKIGGDKGKFTLYRVLSYCIDKYITLEYRKKKIEIIDQKRKDIPFEDFLDIYYNKKYSPEDYDMLFNYEKIVKDFMNKKLNENQRNTFMHFLQGYSMTEIAKIFGCATNNISLSLMRIKRKFKIYFMERDELKC